MHLFLVLFKYLKMKMKKIVVYSGLGFHSLRWLKLWSQSRPGATAVAASQYPQRPQCGIDRATCLLSLSIVILYSVVLLLLLLSFVNLLHLASAAAALTPILFTDLFWHYTPAQLMGINNILEHQDGR